MAVNSFSSQKTNEQCSDTKVHSWTKLALKADIQ